MTSGTPPDSNRNRRLVDEAGVRVVLGNQLGSPGGQGTVYRVEGDADSAVKIWHPDTIPEKADSKMAYMVKNPVLPGIGVQWKTAWPKQAVKENGKTVGYTMPLLDPGQSWAETINYYNTQQARRTEENQQRQLNIQNRARMAYNLALAFQAIHDAGYVIGDVSEKNATINELNDVGILDCDSFGFTDTNTGDKFVDRGGRDEFQAPETNGKYENRTQNHDCFGLAVLIFHFLTGFHPYTVTDERAPNHPGDRIKGGWFPPARRSMRTSAIYQRRWEGLHLSQQELFIRCFDPSRSGWSRPTPAEWVDALGFAPQEWAVSSPAAPIDPNPTPDPAPSPPLSPPTGPQTQPPRRQTQPPRQTQPHPQIQPPRQQTQPQTQQPTQQPQSPTRPSRVPSGSSVRPSDRLLWVSAAAGYGALLPLTLFSQFRPWWWLALILLASLLFYFPVRRLAQTPITRTRWIIIGIAAFFSAWILLALIGAAMSTWPWWMWLGLGFPAAFVLLVSIRGWLLGLIRGPYALKRWAAIGAVALLACFILSNAVAAGIRDWRDRSFGTFWQESPSTANAGGSAVASAAGGASVPVAAVSAPTSTPIPTVRPTNTAIPAPTRAPTNTPPPPPPSTPTLAPTSTPAAPTAALAPTNTPAPPPPTVTLAPTATPFPVSTRTPMQWLIQHPAHPKIVNSQADTQVLLQGCYLGNQNVARRFRLASWDVWDPSRYGNELKFVRIITSTGARLPLEYGACYEATAVKQVDSTEEYVCLDSDSTHSKQHECTNYREHEVIPTFILYPDDSNDPNNYSESFVTIRSPGQ